MIVWRVMAQTDTGGPRVGTSMTTLGIRVRDLHPRLSGLVDPMEGGLSVSPEGEEHLPEAALTLLENEKGAIFALDTESLSPRLAYRPDPNDASHGFIEPATAMKYEMYQREVQQTGDLWESV